MVERARKKIAIVVLNYFKAARVVEGLASLRRQSGSSTLEFIVVDNSVDEEQHRILRSGLEEGEKLICNPKNVGYSRGINVGMNAAGDFDYVLLVNPDIIVDDPATVERLVDQMGQRPDIAVLSPMQSNDDGALVEVARRFPTFFQQFARRSAAGRFVDYDLLKPLQIGGADTTVTVDWVQSSFVLVRGTFWRSIGGLDERYFVFMSDVELGLRARDEGYAVAVTASARVRADGIRASRGGPLSVFRSRVVRIHLHDAFIYHLRHRTFFRNRTMTSSGAH
jgi:N-acetylglucosaminyl-diphospho-decaprenol L-rhamnosyltransferase